MSSQTVRKAHSTEPAVVRPRKPSIMARLAAPAPQHPREAIWASHYVGGGSDWMGEWMSKPGKP